MDTSKSIVITGASSGIGAALTRAFVADGHRLFVCARRADQLTQVASSLPRTFHAPCDVNSEAEVKAFFAQVASRTDAVDVIIHCAAVMGPVGPTHEIDCEEWMTTLRTNLVSAVLVTKYVVPLMLAERRPRILLLSGGGAFDPMPNLSAYGVAKAGTIRLAETLAVELAPRNIAVNVFAPGFVATDIFKSLLDAGPERGGAVYNVVVKLLEEWGEGDIALPLDCARYLISDDAAALTGKTISAKFDPWGEPEFQEWLPEIVKSRLYATQRTNLEHLQGSPMADHLLQALDRRQRGSGG